MITITKEMLHEMNRMDVDCRFVGKHGIVYCEMLCRMTKQKICDAPGHTELEAMQAAVAKCQRSPKPMTRAQMSDAEMVAEFEKLKLLRAQLEYDLAEHAKKHPEADPTKPLPALKGPPPMLEHEEKLGKEPPPPPAIRRKPGRKPKAGTHLPAPEPSQPQEA